MTNINAYVLSKLHFKSRFAIVNGPNANVDTPLEFENAVTTIKNYITKTEDQFRAIQFTLKSDATNAGLSQTAQDDFKAKFDQISSILGDLEKGKRGRFPFLCQSAKLSPCPASLEQFLPISHTISRSVVIAARMCFSMMRTVRSICNGWANMRQSLRLKWPPIA